MADETVRERALEFAFRAARESGAELRFIRLGDAVSELLEAGDRIAAWLEKPIVTKLVLKVGPVTEQP